MFKPSLTPLVLRISAFNWMTTSGISAGILYVIQSEYGVWNQAWKYVLFPSILFSVLMVVVSMLWTREPASVLWRIVLLGFSGLIPMLLIACVVALSYLAIVPAPILPYLWSAIIITTVMWCWIALSGYQQRIKDRHFIEREFLFEEDRIVVSHPVKTSLDADPISDKTLLGRLYHRFGPYLVMGIPLAYPIQSLLSDTGGVSAVLLLLAILGFPLALYILGRLTCGAYLWVYKVWQLQRQHGKPVVFATSD